MYKKAKQALGSKNGLALILVLAMGALFIAFTTAVLHGAAALTASANQLLPREDVYAMACSFAEVVDAQLTATGQNSLKNFAMNNFIGQNFYSAAMPVTEANTYDCDYDYSFEYDGEHDAGAAPGEPVITLRFGKQKLDGRQNGNGIREGILISPGGSTDPLNDCNWTAAVDNATRKNQIEAFEKGGYDYCLTVTTTVQLDAQKFSVTRKYWRIPLLEAYYQDDDGNTYTYEGGTDFKKRNTGEPVSFSVQDRANVTLYCYYLYMNQATAQAQGLAVTEPMLERVGG